MPHDAFGGVDPTRRVGPRGPLGVPMPANPLFALKPGAQAQAADNAGAMRNYALQQFMQMLTFLIMGLLMAGVLRGGRRGVPAARDEGADDGETIMGGGEHSQSGGGRRMDMGEGRQPAVERQGRKIGANIAAAFDDMVLAAARDGVRLRIVSGYRTVEERNPDWTRHEDGTALDFANTRGAYGWLARHASAFGFHNRKADQPWHYSTDGQ